MFDAMTDAAVITAPYRQAARRIRARLAHRPAAMLAALRDLAAAQPPSTPIHNAPPDLPPAAGEAFSQLVLDHLDGPVLRFSVRQKLLRQADALGLGRFEANLLIALVEHRHRQSPVLPPRRTRRNWRAMVIFLLIQSIILAAAWAALAGGIS